MARTSVATFAFTGTQNNVLDTAYWTAISRWLPGDEVCYSASNGFYAGSGGGEAGARYTGSGSFTADHYSSVLLPVINDAWDAYIGALGRCSADSGTGRDWYQFRIQNRQDAGACRAVLSKIVNNTETSLDTTPAGVTLSANDRIEIECEGTAIRGMVNGSTTHSATDSDLTTGLPGIFANGRSATFRGDDWDGGSLGAGAAAAIASTISGRRNKPGRGPYSVGRYFRATRWLQSDSPSALNVYQVTISETGSAADTLTATIVATATIAESASAADTMAAALAAIAALAETAAATDSVSAALAAVRTVTETATAADTISSVLAAAAALSETGSATDSYAAIASLVAALSESVSATDQVNWGGGTSYSADIAEAASATDSLTAAVAALAALAETGNATDTISALASLQAALAESGTALDVLTAAGVFNVTVTETGNAVDTFTALGDLLPAPATRTVTVQMANRTITVRAVGRVVKVN